MAEQNEFYIFHHKMEFNYQKHKKVKSSLNELVLSNPAAKGGLQLGYHD